MMETFEATESRANTGTGSRREGEKFEHITGALWSGFRQIAEMGGAHVGIVYGGGNKKYARLTVEKRALFVPALKSEPLTDTRLNQFPWLEVEFTVENTIASFPIKSYAPKSGPYADNLYPNIYKGMKTRFDDTVVLVENGVLRKKILLEYKTAKSSDRRQIDGNAHERLSFQIMQYLEVATRYTSCSLMVIANGAFIRYRNKYHVNFHAQSDRLKNFAWFSMGFSCAAGEYENFLESLLAWLFKGRLKDRRSL